MFGPWPGQFVELVADSTGTNGWEIMDNMIGNASLPGAWLTQHWNYTTAPCAPNCYVSGSNPRADISNWELLVITENFEGPANNALNSSREFFSQFVNNSWQNGNSGNGTPVMLWTNWPGIDGSGYFFNGYGIAEATNGTATGWRQLLDFLENQGVGGTNGWLAMQDYANANRPVGSTPVYIIPGNRMMARFYDDVQSGLVPGITHINQIFTDGVHPNNIGAYMVTMIHYACIFGKSPVGLSNNLHPDVTINPALATYIQNMVWNVVINYPRSGVSATTSVAETQSDYALHIFPNPSNNFLNIQSNDPNFEVEVYNTVGQMILKSESKTLNISSLNKGVYIINVNGNITRFVKE